MAYDEVYHEFSCFKRYAGMKKELIKAIWLFLILREDFPAPLYLPTSHHPLSLQ